MSAEILERQMLEKVSKFRDVKKEVFKKQADNE